MRNKFENFTHSIYKINKLIQRIKCYEMREYGLQAIHVMCLHYLSQGGMTASELMRKTLEDKAAISRALKALSDKGLIEYDGKKYNSVIRLTDNGTQLMRAVYDKEMRAVESVSEDFTDAEREFFYSSLNNISDKIEKYYEELKQHGKDKISD